MSVKALTACGPRCFRCLLDMPSGPVLGEIRVAPDSLSDHSRGEGGRPKCISACPVQETQNSPIEGTCG